MTDIYDPWFNEWTVNYELQKMLIVHVLHIFVWLHNEISYQFLIVEF